MADLDRFVRGVWIPPDMLRECLGLPESVSIDAMEVDHLHHRLMLRLSSAAPFSEIGGDTLFDVSHNGHQLYIPRGQFAPRRPELQL